MSKSPKGEGYPLIVVKCPFWDAFADGSKRVEYRLHKPPFTRRAFPPDRWVRIAYNYNITRVPYLLGWVRSFDIARAADCPDDVRRVYPDLPDDAEIACIGIEIERRVDP